MGFQDTAFLPSLASVPPHFLKNVVESKASGPPHVLNVATESQGMLPVVYFHSNKATLCQLNFIS